MDDFIAASYVFMFLCFLTGNTPHGVLFLCNAAQSCASIYPHKALRILSEADQQLETVRKSLANDPEKQHELLGIESLYQEATGNSWHCIGNNSREASDVTKGLNAYKESYLLRDRIYGKKANKPDLARALAGLGACQSLHASILRDSEGKLSKHIKEKFKTALECFKKSLKMFEKCFRYSSEIPIILQNIGNAYQEGDNYKDAYKYFKKALQKEKDLKIDGFYNTARIMFNISNTCRDLDKDAEALRYAKESFQIRKELLKNHPDTVKSLYLLAVIHHEQNLLVDAIEYYKRAFWMEEELPANFHSRDRKDIRRNMKVAFEEAIECGNTYFQDEFEEWTTCFKELVSSIYRSSEDIKFL